MRSYSGTAAELEPHSAPLRYIDFLSSGEIRGASLCLGQRVTQGTPWASWPLHFLQARATQSLPVCADRLCTLPSATRSQAPSLPLAGLHYGANKELL